MSKAPVLLCESVEFCSMKDEEAFFEWIKKLNCIERFDQKGSLLKLYIVCSKLHNEDLDELIGLFYRYNIDMKQLAIFLNDDNKRWFYDPKMFWFEKVFGQPNETN